MYEDVLHFWMHSAEPGASDEVVRRLKVYGSTHPQLYLVALRYLTSTPALLADVRDVLEYIDEVDRDAARDYADAGAERRRECRTSEGLAQRIQTARAEIQSDQKWTTSYQLETAAKLKQVADLADPEHPRVFKCYSVFPLWRAVRPPECAFHVQPQLPSAAVYIVAGDPYTFGELTYYKSLTVDLEPIARMTRWQTHCVWEREPHVVQPLTLPQLNLNILGYLGVTTDPPLNRDVANWLDIALGSCLFAAQVLVEVLKISKNIVGHTCT
ncbi:hypothetical protein K438DRAFT_1756353 [Mycena galopus ATCC 62051]|nr:hypothetical protein K438DRAFT_1756353 [Mycena galopus ATCC 62051]